MDGQTASPSPPSDPDSDVTLVASIGGSDGNSDYVEAAKISPTSRANKLELVGHLSKLEEMHEVTEGEHNAITRPTMLFSHTDKLGIQELVDAETNLLENHQDNGTTPPVNTQPSPPHSSPEDTSVASADPPPRPRVEAGDAALQAREGDLPDIRLHGAVYMLYGVYQDWVHQNLGYHLDGGIAEDSKWQARWKNSLV